MLSSLKRNVVLLGTGALILSGCHSGNAKTVHLTKTVSVPHAVAVAVGTSSLPSAENSTVPIGVNLEGLSDYMSAPVFVDAMKTSRKFGSAEKPWDGTVPLDTNGYPLSDAGSVVITGLPHMGGVYHFSCIGKTGIVPVLSDATVTRWQYNSAKNCTTAEINVPDKATQLMLSFHNTQGGVKDIHVIRPGYPADTTQIFTNEFLQAVRPFKVIRLMDFLNTNGNPSIHWGDRNTSETAQWTNGKGGPWEAAIALANETHKDLWVNIPDQADDDYVKQLATLFKKTLNPDSKVYLEYSNEVWNYGFVQAGRNQQAAEIEAKDPKSPLRVVTDVQWDDANNKYYWGDKRVAEHLLQISAIWQDVYGKAALNQTIRPVLASQIANSFILKLQLGMIAKVYGPPSHFIYAVAGAPYFNIDDASMKRTDLTVDQTLACFTASISKMGDQWLLPYAQIAQSYGVKFFAYEGGPDIGQTEQSVDAKIAANRDPRMKDVIVNYLDTWYANGGDLFMYFTLTGGYSKWGCWGMMEDITKPTPKTAGLAQVMTAARPAVRTDLKSAQASASH